MADLSSLLALLLCFVAILFTVKFFGYVGLYVLSVIIAISSNIQVLKVTDYMLWHEPLALGTVTFASTFAIDNILSEYYSKDIAKRSVYIGFIGYLFFSLQMYLCMLHPSSPAGDIEYSRAIDLLFSPSIALFLSSLTSFFFGQMSDVNVYTYLKRSSKVKSVYLRSFISIAIANFIDNAVFSILAWKVFCVQEVSWEMLWKTYIIGTYVFRMIISLLCIPIVKIAGSMYKRDV